MPPSRGAKFQAHGEIAYTCTSGHKNTFNSGADDNKPAKLGIFTHKISSLSLLNAHYCALFFNAAGTVL